MSMKPTLSTAPAKAVESGLLERRAAVKGILGDTKDMLIVTGLADLCEGAVARHLGTLAATLERWSEASVHFERALEIDGRLGARPYQARTKLALARMLAARSGVGDLARAATELARDWRTDRALRRLEAMLIVVNDESSFLISGTGDVVQPTDGVIGIGSGGQYATAAARALLRNTSLSPAAIVRQSLSIAAEIDVFTNENLIVEELSAR